MYDENEWVREMDVSKIMKRSVSALRLDRHKKRGLPYTKIGGMVRYRVGDVYAYLEKFKVDPEVISVDAILQCKPIPEHEQLKLWSEM